MQYSREKLKRIPLDVPRKYYDEVIFPEARRRGMSVRKFILAAIEEKIKKEGEKEKEMKKQFKDEKEFDKWIDENYGQEPNPDRDPVWDLTPYWEDRIPEAAERLETEGYDLDDLFANGHRYEFAGHANNGWLYRDEVADIAEAEAAGIELREREEAAK